MIVYVQQKYCDTFSIIKIRILNIVLWKIFEQVSRIRYKIILCKAVIILK